MNKTMFVTGLVLLGINIAGILIWIGFQMLDVSKIKTGDFFLPVFIIYNIALLFMVFYGAIQNGKKN